jgi:hypothetical protein
MSVLLIWLSLRRCCAGRRLFEPDEGKAFDRQPATAEKLSHEFDRTEIEPFSNCYSFRSVSVSLQAEQRQRISFNISLPLFSDWMQLIY